MKSYTDLEQSKKLAEILPIEGADLYYEGHQSITNPTEWEYEDTPKIRSKYISFYDKRIFHPCWSLAGLLSIIPIEHNLHGYLIENGMECRMETLYAGNSKSYNNQVDACIDMILKLHEQQLL